MRDDIHVTYDRGRPEIVELGLDDDGNPQWYMSCDDGWNEVGAPDGTLTLSAENYAVGTRIELTETLPDH